MAKRAMTKKEVVKATQEAIITNIEMIRSENNIRWMDILRVAIVNSPGETRAIIRQITKNDREVTRWLAKL